MFRSSFKLNRLALPAIQAVEDAELFRKAVADATPLQPNNRVRMSEARRKPRPIEHDPAVYDSLSDSIQGDAAREPGEPLKFARPGLQKQTLRRLRRGRSVDATLDLHGLTITQARQLLASFLVESRAHDRRRVLIIHGKGRRSESGEGVLKTSVANWLMQWEDVLAFHEAPLASGGGGAVVVLLRSAE